MDTPSYFSELKREWYFKVKPHTDLFTQDFSVTVVGNGATQVLKAPSFFTSIDGIFEMLFIDG